MKKAQTGLENRQKKAYDKAQIAFGKGKSNKGTRLMNRTAKQQNKMRNRNKGEKGIYPIVSGVYKAGGSFKAVPKSNKGLSKLPKSVRNKMGYAKKGKEMKDYYGGGSQMAPAMDQRGRRIPGMFQDGGDPKGFLSRAQASGKRWLQHGVSGTKKIWDAATGKWVFDVAKKVVNTVKPKTKSKTSPSTQPKGR